MKPFLNDKKRNGKNSFLILQGAQIQNWVSSVFFAKNMVISFNMNLDALMAMGD